MTHELMRASNGRRLIAPEERVVFAITNFKRHANNRGHHHISVRRRRDVALHSLAKHEYNVGPLWIADKFESTPFPQLVRQRVEPANVAGLIHHVSAFRLDQRVRNGSLRRGRWAQPCDRNADDQKSEHRCPSEASGRIPCARFSAEPSKLRRGHGLGNQGSAAATASRHTFSARCHLPSCPVLMIEPTLRETSGTFLSPGSNGRPLPRRRPRLTQSQHQRCVRFSKRERCSKVWPRLQGWRIASRKRRPSDSTRTRDTRPRILLRCPPRGGCGSARFLSP